jgi:hypothetical protein
MPAAGWTIYGWRVGDLSYLVIAQGMDERRLQTIAASVHWSSVHRETFGSDARTALRSSRRASRPCLAA